MSAEEAAKQAVVMRSQIHLFWGNMLFERSQVECKLGMSGWKKNLDVAVEHFKLAGASEADISMVIKNHCSNGNAREGEVKGSRVYNPGLRDMVCCRKSALVYAELIMLFGGSKAICGGLLVIAESFQLLLFRYVSTGNFRNRGKHRGSLAVVVFASQMSSSFNN
ncbi:hypothetical protein VNO77_01802 [Canavalia gladiata]|uniref:Uncharacterized protein n=1 Tax=Canavalia gladiata TaxID=3824 RepID=A0AAN9R5B1_CANGL